MLFALLLLAGLTDWVPMRWISADPKSLDLLKGTPINCVMLDQQDISPQFIKAAADAGVSTLGVIHPGEKATGEVRRAIDTKLAGVVLEGDFEAATAQRIRNTLTDSRVPLIELLARSRMNLDNPAPVIGTYQGVWPGVQVETSGSTKAAPSGAPWIDTNTGFLRFVRAATKSTVWIANSPPANLAVTTERYMQAISDAEMNNARWVVALDADFSKRLLAREPNALKDWTLITNQLAYYETHHNEWHALKPAGELALVTDVASGGLLSGGILDMIATKHTPVRAVPTRHLDDAAMKNSKMAVDVDAATLTPEQKDVLRRFTRAGGTLLSAPPGWKFPELKPEQITLSDNDVKVLDEIWKELNTMTGRRNLGARLFNVSSMLSNLLQSQDGKETLLQLVNYSGFPVENVTVHMLGKFTRARLMMPDGTDKALKVYDNEDGSGIDIDKIGVAATLVLE
jgi:hypothetical protein